MQFLILLFAGENGLVQSADSSNTATYDRSKDPCVPALQKLDQIDEMLKNSKLSAGERAELNTKRDAAKSYAVKLKCI